MVAGHRVDGLQQRHLSFLLLHPSVISFRSSIHSRAFESPAAAAACSLPASAWIAWFAAAALTGENQSKMTTGFDLPMLGPAVAGPPAERLSY